MITQSHCSLAGKTSKSSKGLDIHLDLFNFEDPAAQQSRYVLTSPRSLEVIIIHESDNIKHYHNLWHLY